MIITYAGGEKGGLYRVMATAKRQKNELRCNDVIFNVNRTGDFARMGHFETRVLDLKI